MKKFALMDVKNALEKGAMVGGDDSILFRLWTSFQKCHLEASFSYQRGPLLLMGTTLKRNINTFSVKSWFCSVNSPLQMRNTL